jgi:hypothetical protein
MALGHVVTKDHSRVILPFDDAIGKGASYEEYLKSGYDEKHLKLDPLKQPTRFTIKQTGDLHRKVIDRMDTIRDRWAMTVKCALLAVSGYVWEVNGVDRELPPIEKTNTAAGEVITDGWMETVNFPDSVLKNLAELIVHNSEVRDPLSMRSKQQLGQQEQEKSESTSG